MAVSVERRLQRTDRILRDGQSELARKACIARHQLQPDPAKSAYLYSARPTTPPATP
jgi:hypothetical protein